MKCELLINANITIFKRESILTEMLGNNLSVAESL